MAVASVAINSIINVMQQIRYNVTEVKFTTVIPSTQSKP